ncbi:hypothetical protein IFO70_34250 [Phormidium tenue FACHB-886]|nr:hypothetical protein [Phormidium tenue FACHB-886]
MALKRVAKALRRVKTLGYEGGLIVFFSGRLMIGGLRFSIIFRQLVVGGVPCSIIVDFLQDRTARRAYFRQDSKALHDRLCSLGIEERIKDFYRPQIFDEVELDRYIHQLLYEPTGYVGRDYVVNAKGVLLPKDDVKDIT